jgi:hypothetical protein
MGDGGKGVSLVVGHNCGLTGDKGPLGDDRRVDVGRVPAAARPSRRQRIRRDRRCG